MMAEKLVAANVIWAPEQMTKPIGSRAEEMPLSCAKPGEALEVVRINGGEALRAKIMALGIIPGAVISLVQAGPGRPVVVAVGGSRLVLDWKSAESVGVRSRVESR